MSFTIHPFCENDWDNATDVPRNCVHCGPLSLGLLPKDYRADAAYLWRAGINPNSNLLVASTSYERGIVGSVATSTPRYWWIAGPINDQPTLEDKVKEVVGRLPERAPDNYEPFADYEAAYDWARVNGYALINCNYPAYRLGDYDNTTKALINIESGFLPSFDGSQAKLRNLANPTPSTGFGNASPRAVPHETVVIQTAGSLGSPIPGIGSEPGIQLTGTDHISQTANPILNGITNGIIFEGVMAVPSSSTNYTLLQGRDSGNGSRMELLWKGAANGWAVTFGGTTVYGEAVPSAALTAGKYYFCVAIPKTQSGGSPVNLYISSRGPSNPIILQEMGGGGQSWPSAADMRFSFGSTYTGGSGGSNVDRFYSAKVHDLVAAWDSTSADVFYDMNWPIVEALYTGILP